MELEKKKISRRDLFKIGAIFLGGAAMGEFAYVVRKRAGEEIDNELKRRREEKINGSITRLPNP